MQLEDFLDKVQNEADLENTDQALQMTKVVLGTLGEWLYRTEADKLEAQLPKGLKGFLFQEKEPERFRSDVLRYRLEEFYNRITARADVPFDKAIQGGQAVACVLQEAVSRGQIEDVLRELPDEFNQLFS